MRCLLSYSRDTLVEAPSHELFNTMHSGRQHALWMVEHTWPCVCICVVYVWCMCGVCVVYVWCMCGVCVVYVWCMCGVCVVYVWCMCGVCVCLCVCLCVQCQVSLKLTIFSKLTSSSCTRVSLPSWIKAASESGREGSRENKRVLEIEGTISGGSSEGFGVEVTHPS